jgi:Ca-activated chloride channel family protein
MKRMTAVVCASVGALLSSAVAMAVPIQPGSNLTSPPPLSSQIRSDGPSSHVTAGRTLLMDARLGHGSLPRSTTPGETYLFASVTGAETKSAAPIAAPPLDLAIVVDRSGSMKGERIVNALAAAVGAVERMREGDNVTVVSFDTEAQVVVPSTRVGSSTRASIEAAIRSIRLGGDTCISCGLETARREIDRGRAVAGIKANDRVTRMLLLSDGATNNGIRDVPGLRALASRMRERGCAITTIGVDVDFDEKVMGVLANESNGHHYFVANAAQLPAVFNTEFDTLVATIAQEGEVVVEPAAGVEIAEVFDRSFRREGSRIVVPLGSFSAKDEKSLLVRLRVPADHDGSVPVAQLKLTYRDLADGSGSGVSFNGGLALTITNDGTAQPDMDPFVRARVERSTTARTLEEANDLIRQGRPAEAQTRLTNRSNDLLQAQAKAKTAPPSFNPSPSRARSFGKDFDDQANALNNANKAAGAAASASPTSRTAKEAPKRIELDLQSDPFR